MRTTQDTKSHADTNSDDIPDLITKNISLNDKTASIVHNVLLSTKTITTPEGRQAVIYQILVVHFAELAIIRFCLFFVFYRIKPVFWRGFQLKSV